MEAITIPHVRIPSINIGGICLPGIGTPGSVGKKGLVWPAGMKEHIKAWYDPKKQGLTNYDVIEAYTEDFKKWNNSPEKYTGSLTSNSLALTNVSQKTALIYSPIKPYDFKVLIRGLQEGQHVKFGFDYGEIILEADKDGVYTLEWKEGLISYGIYTNFVGECNITITQLPTSILKDFSGNGNHAYLYGGKGKLNSGMGVYTYDYNSDRWSSTGRADYIITKKGFEFTNIIEDGGIIFALGSNIAKEGDKVKVKISGIPNGGMVYFGTWITATEDGEYLGTYAYDNNGNTTIGTLGCIGATITLEFIPDYPNQLCYDGGMCAVAYEFPILTDYTAIADRTWFDIRDISCFIGKRNRSGDNLGAFEFEFRANQALSFGRINSIIFADSGIVYQTKNSYNGIGIESGLLDDTDVLIIGAAQQNINNRPQDIYIGCHGKIIIADRSFTEDEITWLKDNWKKI